MNELICPFTATLVKNDFSCKRATKIIRRGGNEFACSFADAHSRCTSLFQGLKDVALPVFELEDDLLQVPHGILVKIQFGGLLGLQRICSDTKPEETGVRDIDDLVAFSIENFNGLDAIPFDRLREDITTYKLSRRRKRK